MPTYLERLVVEERSRLAFYRAAQVDPAWHALGGNEAWKKLGDELELKLAKTVAARAKESAAEWAVEEALHPPFERAAKHGSAEAPYEERHCPNCDRVCAGELCVSCGLDEL